MRYYRTNCLSENKQGDDPVFFSCSVYIKVPY